MYAYTFDMCALNYQLFCNVIINDERKLSDESNNKKTRAGAGKTEKTMKLYA